MHNVLNMKQLSLLVSAIWHTNGHPGTGSPLNLMSIVWLLGHSGVKWTRHRPPPNTWTWFGTAPSFMAISSWPSPACDASTLQGDEESLYKLHNNASLRRQDPSIFYSYFVLQFVSDNMAPPKNSESWHQLFFLRLFVRCFYQISKTHEFEAKDWFYCLAF